MFVFLGSIEGMSLLSNLTELSYFLSKCVYTTACPVPTLRKRTENIADVTTSFEPSFPFVANLVVLFSFLVSLKTLTQF